MAGRGKLTGPRLVPLWLTLQRNREYWTTGTSLGLGQRGSRSRAPSSSGSTTRATGSRSSGWATSASSTAAGARSARRARRRSCSTSCCRSRVERAGGLAWEYYFPFDGGQPPWVSWLAQGTGVQAMARVAKRLDRQAEVLPDRPGRRWASSRRSRPTACACRRRRRRALPAVLRSRPDLHILNGFIQSLVGLYDFAAADAATRRRRRCSTRASAAARDEVPTLRHRRLVAVLARLQRARVRPRLPPAAARLPRQPVHAHAGRPSTADRRAHFTPYLTRRRSSAAAAPRTLRGGKLGKRAASSSRRSRAWRCRSRARRRGYRRSAAVRIVGHGKPTLELEGAEQGRRLHGDGDRDATWPGNAAAAEPVTVDGLEAQEVAGAFVRPRTILYTGKGGVGKTSVAAATARRCAAARRAHAGPLHRPGALARGRRCRRRSAASRPTVGDGLWAQQVQAQDELERHWCAVQDVARRRCSMERGVDRIAAEELTVPPGGDELFSLLQLKRHVESGDWDVIVVDCAPTGETLRLLSFPDAARWWLDKVFGREQSMLAAARPLARMFLDVPLPDEQVMAEVQRLVGNLVAMHELLRDASRVSMRLVMTPDRMVDRRGDAHVHLPEPVRLPDRRRGRQPGLPGRARRRLLRRLARGPARAARARRVRLRAGAGAAGAVLRAGGDRARRCSTGWPTRCSTRSDAGRGAARPADAGADARQRRGRSCGSTCRSPARATSR